MERHDNQKLSAFKNSLNRIVVVRINPQNMDCFSRGETQVPRLDMSNFADWYRHLSSIDQEAVFMINRALSEAIPGFRSFAFEPSGEVRKLTARMASPDDRGYSYNITELSDGQRALIALYALIHSTPGGGVLCLDEPENNVALPEIQPWLDALMDHVESRGIQSILISHHPRLINYLVRADAHWLDKDDATSPTRMRAVVLEPEPDGLPASQLVERGWIIDA